MHISAYLQPHAVISIHHNLWLVLLLSHKRYISMADKRTNAKWMKKKPAIKCSHYIRITSSLNIVWVVCRSFFFSLLCTVFFRMDLLCMKLVAILFSIHFLFNNSIELEICARSHHFWCLLCSPFIVSSITQFNKTKIIAIKWVHKCSTAKFIIWNVKCIEGTNSTETKYQNMHKRHIEMMWKQKHHTHIWSMIFITAAAQKRTHSPIWSSRQWVR